MDDMDPTKLLTSIVTAATNMEQEIRKLRKECAKLRADLRYQAETSDIVAEINRLQPIVFEVKVLVGSFEEGEDLIWETLAICTSELAAQRIIADHREESTETAHYVTKMVSLNKSRL